MRTGTAAPTPHARRAPGAVLTAALAVGLAGVVTPGVASAQDGWLTVEPSTVSPGGQLQVEGLCPGGAQGESEVEVLAGDGLEGGLLGRVPIAEDGSFSGTAAVHSNSPITSGEVAVPCPDGQTVLTAPLTIEEGDGHPFGDEIQWVLTQGIATGYDDGEFRGERRISRQAMAAFVHRLAHDGEDAPACESAPFPDVPVDHPFCGSIAWLADTGLSTGYDDGTYRPSRGMSRQAMAAFFHRLFTGDDDAPDCGTAPFADVGEDHPFCGEIFWMLNTEISTGYDDATYRPDRRVSRQAMAAFMYRAVVERDLVPADRG